MIRTLGATTTSTAALAFLRYAHYHNIPRCERGLGLGAWYLRDSSLPLGNQLAGSARPKQFLWSIFVAPDCLDTRLRQQNLLMTNVTRSLSISGSSYQVFQNGGMAGCSA